METHLSCGAQQLPQPRRVLKAGQLDQYAVRPHSLDRRLRHTGLVDALPDDLQALLDRGIHAYLSTFTTGVYHRIWSLHRRGERDDALALYRRLLPCLAFMTTHQRIQWRFTKALLQAEGIFTTSRVRTAAPELDEVETRLTSELAVYARDLAASVQEPGH